MLHKVKVSIALKSLIRWIYDHEVNKPDKIEISLGFANNLFGFSCRWKTSLSNVKALVEENNSLTGIASSTSSLWFNFFPENNTIEAFGLISFAMDAQNSFPQITNAYSLGLKIFPAGGSSASSLIKTFGIADSQNLILKKYIGTKKRRGRKTKCKTRTRKNEIGTGHGIYVVKTAISGHGVTLKDLSSIIEASGGVKIQNWNATQENWMNEAVSLLGMKSLLFLSPHFGFLKERMNQIYLSSMLEMEN